VPLPSPCLLQTGVEMKNEQTKNKTKKDTKTQDWIFPRSVSLNFEESLFLKVG